MSTNPNKIISLQELIDAQVDAYKLEQIMNEAPWVEITTRLGRKCYSIATINAIIEQFQLDTQSALSDLQDAIAQIVEGGVPDLAVATWSGRTQADKNKENISAQDYGAEGNGEADDTQAFVDLEATHQGQIIDLLGKTYATSKEFFANKYVNGFFKIDGVVHPSAFSPVFLSKKKYCMNFLTVVGGSPVFSAADTGVFQGICIVPQTDGTLRLYVTNRSNRTDGITPQSNWLKHETYRIVEYAFTEDGSDVTPISFSEPLDIGHASYLSYTIEDGQLYFYSGLPSDSLTDTTRSNKGFSRIRWRGALTSNADVELYQLYDYVGGRYGYLHKGAVSVSKSGKYLMLSSDNQITGQYTTHIFLLSDLLSASNPKTVDPLHSFDWSSDGKTAQGTALTDEYIVSVYDDKDHTTSLKVRTFDGCVIHEINYFDLYRSVYNEAQLMGQGGVFTTLETEGVCIFGNDIYIGYRDYISTPTSYVSYNGRYFAPIEASTNIPPSNSLYWQEVMASVAVGATAWNPDTSYSTTGYTVTSYNKRIYKLSALDGGDLFKSNGKPQAVTIARERTIDLSVGYKMLGYDAFDETTTELVTHGAGGGALFKAKTVNDTALSSSVNGTGTFFGGYRYDTLYFGGYASTANTIISSRNGNNLVLCANADDSGGASPDSNITRTGIVLENNVENQAVRPTRANTIQLGLNSYRFSKAWFNTLNVNSIQVYADNAAAAAGGLIAGDVYRTSTGVLMIRY
jgi:hypothetical protein